MTADPPTSSDRSGAAPGGGGERRAPTVLVTGAGGALGEAVVRRFVAGGSQVLAVGRTLESLEPRVALAPERVHAHAADLADAGAVAAAFDAAEALGGPVAVAHLVGGFRFSTLAELSDDDWRFLVQANLETSFLVVREAARRCEAAQGSENGAGSLVAVSAPAALLGAAGVGAYAATKAAVLRLVESLAREVSPFGGRANAVLPGTMDTPANRAAMPDADPAAWVTTARVADVIHWLACDAVAVNGAAVRVPGPSL